MATSSIESSVNCPFAVNKPCTCQAKSKVEQFVKIDADGAKRIQNANTLTGNKSTNDGTPLAGLKILLQDSMYNQREATARQLLHESAWHCRNLNLIQKAFYLIFNTRI